MIDSIGRHLNPVFGNGQAQNWEYGVSTIPVMGNSSRKTLAANINRLMASKPSLSTPAQVVKAGGATNGTLGRIRLAEVGASIDQVDALAKAFGVEPWQLLVPNLDPKALPVLGSSQAQYRKILESIRLAAAQAESIGKIIDTHNDH